MFHFGGEAWRQWNAKLLAILLPAQETAGPHKGSWSSTGDAHGAAGGRLMVTSLNLLTLEVYYRHLPLYFRAAAGDGMAAKK
jgi:hypothetical protein